MKYQALPFLVAGIIFFTIYTLSPSVEYYEDLCSNILTEETINVVFVVKSGTPLKTQIKSLEFVSNSIKSILYYTASQINFHLITDDDARQPLTDFFDKLNANGVTVSFYNGSSFLPLVSSVKTSHYSGNFALLKVVLPEIIPESVDKAVFLDVDTMLTTDISLLWREFKHFSKEAAIGMVEEQAIWYGRVVNWTVIGRGFNSGVILLDLNRLRHYNWSRVWGPIVEEEMEKFNLTELRLPDMDILNAVLARRPRWSHALPCGWNVQMSNPAKPEQRCLDDSPIFLIHYNNPQKLSSQKWRRFTALRKHYSFLNNMKPSIIQ